MHSTTAVVHDPPQPVQINIPDFNAFYLQAVILILSSITAILSWLFKRELQRFASEQKELLKQVSIQSRQIATLDKQINELEKREIRTFATRQELVRNVTVLDAKLDAMHRRIDEIKTILLKGVTRDF